MANQVTVLMTAEDRLSPAFQKAGNAAAALDSKLDHMGGTMGQTGKHGSALGNILQTGVGVALGGLVFQAAGAATQLATMGISFNAMKESAQVAFTTILGSGEKATKLMGELQQFAAETPFAFEELANATKSLIAFGIEGDKSVEVLRRLGDIASGVGAPLNDIAQIYGKARVQGRLFAEDINQLTGRGIPIIQELAKQFGVAESEVSKMVEEGKVGFENLETAIVSLTNKGGKFSGMMEAQSKTFSGLMSTFMDNINQLAGAITAPIFDVLVQGLTQVNALMGGGASADMGWLGEFGNAMNVAAGQINAALLPAMEALTPLFEEFGRTAGPLVNQVLAALGNEIVTHTIPNMTRMIVMFLQTIPPTVEFAKVVGGVLNDALARVGVVWGDLNRTVESGLKWITETHAAFLETVETLMGPVAEGFQWFIDNVLNPFTQALAALKNYIGQVMDALRNLAGAIGGAGSDPLGWLGGIINGAAGGSNDRLGGGVGGGVNNFGGSRTQNNNINIVLPNVRTERDARQVANALNGIARGAMLRGAQGLT